MVSRMNLVVLDIECIENEIEQELAFYKNGKVVESFFPPKKFGAQSQSTWCTKPFMESVPAAYTKKIIALKFLKILVTSEMKVFRKNYEEGSITSDFQGKNNLK